MGSYAKEIDDIIKTLKDVNKGLAGKSRQEQERIINAERDNLLGFAQTALGNTVPVVGPIFAWCTMTTASAFGYNPFGWLHYEKDSSANVHNAKMAHKRSSDSNLWNALMKAGEIFERKESRHLNEKSKEIRANVTTISEANKLAALIIDFCKVLPVLNGQPVLLDANDVKEMLATTIKLILNSANLKQRVRETFSRPIIKPGAYAWVKYKFSSDYDIESSCCTETKFVELKLKVMDYFFPSEAAFREALCEVK